MFRIGSVSLACLLLACSAKYRLTDEKLTHFSSWPFHHGDLSARGAVRGGTFNGKLDVLWEQKVSGKPAGPLTIYYGCLIHPGAKNRIKFFNSRTGEYLGYLKSRGSAQTGVVVYDSLAYFATSPYRSWLRCINLRTGKQVWKQPIKDATTGSIIVESSLVVSTTDGMLAAYRLEDGHQTWVFEIEGGCGAPPAYSDGKIFQPGDRGFLYCVSAKDGLELYSVEASGPMVGAVSISEKILATDMYGNVYAVDPEYGRIVWKTTLGGPVWTTPAVADGRVFVGHSSGELVALDESSGQVLWQFETGEVIKAPPIVVGDYVLVGTMGGKLFSLNTGDGKVVGQRQLNGAVAHSPVTDGERVYAATELGEIVCMGWKDEHTTSSNH